ncbi:hypothetical protein [Serratia sp. UGAL515B_01]|uniref:helix-turn-helix domain-containing protein n=1 Tax=Serratia sp. UGAL515B_01 TaxID=2986763 RepID=UPI0029537F44|nr:hypothetical protein [Serratia sp. UGAL515B_01]WON75518.1 hypothetical protein OK023_00185 [Serratia sp. UGAL515B_01]
MANSLKTLGERLEFALTKLKISQAHASLSTGVAQTTISHLVRTQARTYKNSRALADGLRINHDWLVYGKGGIFNPTAKYLPIIHDYFRLGLYQSQGFLDENSQYLISDQYYGTSMFATILNEEVLICSTSEGNTKKPLKYLIWTEDEKFVIDSDDENKKSFFIHEIRTYGELPSSLLVSF